MTPIQDSAPPANRPSIVSRLLKGPASLLGSNGSVVSTHAYEAKVRSVLPRLREALLIALGERDELRTEVEQLKERLSHAEAAVRQLQRVPDHVSQGHGARRVGVRRPAAIGIVR